MSTHSVPIDQETPSHALPVSVAFVKARKEFVFLQDGREIYWVDTDRCGTCAELLDWIFQLHGKAWVSPEVMFDFLTLVQVHIAPQSTMCSMGVEKT